MPTAILRPRAAGSSADWTPSSGTNYAAAADETDGLSNSTTANAQVDLFLFDALPAEAYSIDQVDLFRRQNCLPGSSVKGRVRLGGVNVDGAAKVGITGNEDVNDSTMARPGGGTWLVSDFETLEAGYLTSAIDGGGDTVVVEGTWLVVTYSLRDEAPHDPGTDMSQAEVLRSDPVRIELRIALDSADVDHIDDVSTHTITFGPVLLGGQTYPLNITLSQESVVTL